MEFGICIPHYGKVLDVRNIIENVQYAETMGFDSVWVTDHIIVPKTMDLIYRDHMLEPVTVLSHVAGLVPRVKLGTSVLIRGRMAPSGARPSTGPEKRSAPRAGQRLAGVVASRWRPPARSLRGRDRRG
jgi:luciferase-like monooxygenase